MCAARTPEISPQQPTLVWRGLTLRFVVSRLTQVLGLFPLCTELTEVRTFRFVSYLTLSTEHKAYQLHDPSVL
jgi:hypothetical protein